jgi:DNA polymerase III subunit epsilon
MVQDAPSFEEVAEDVFNLLKDRVFVAHNVNFDYSFLKHHLALVGFDLQCKKLCTVRLGRKIFPGLTSYGLGKFCNHLNVPITNRHRAGGDAEATALLFSLILEGDKEGYIRASLNKNSKEQLLPPNLPKDCFNALPSTPGVYYFKNEKGKVIYVGKAKDLKKRVLSHFTGNNSGRQRQEFLKNIHSISFEECGTELMAFILEAVEIKRLWPSNNRALKRFEQAYGLYSFEDQKGYLRLAIDKRTKYSTPLYSFNNAGEGYNLLIGLMRKFKLCHKLCFFQTGDGMCSKVQLNECLGACEGKEDATSYNARVTEAINYLKTSLPSYGYLDKGRSAEEYSLILMEEGKLYGMGYIDSKLRLNDDPQSVKSQLTQYPCNDYIRNLIRSYAERYPERRVFLSK